MSEFLLMSKLVLLALLSVVVAAGSAVAHGNEKHPEKMKMGHHMQAMMAAKEKVPEEYRIMERAPLIPDEQSLARGAELFGQKCSVCHGENGDGNGPAAAALPTPPANFLDTQHSSMYNPGEKYWIIGNGSGPTGMPAFQNLSPADRWHLVNHILSLQQNEKLEELFTTEKKRHD
jgi:mono/diheme cytochrome c family protein